MKPKVKLIVGLVIAAAALLALVAVVVQDTWPLRDMILWTVLCLVSEFFWVKTPKGDSVQSLALTTNLSTFLVLEPLPAMLAVFVSNVAGNILFRRSKWYRALYNGSQLMLAAGAASVLYLVLSGHPFQNLFALSLVERTRLVVTTVGNWRFLAAFLATAATYIGVNNSLMAWLMNAMTGRPMLTLWKENCLYPEEVQSNLALILLTPLMILLYGALGIVGLVILFASLALVHQANRRYLALDRAENSLVRSQRMAAMGEMAQEIGRSLEDYLKELKGSAGRVLQRARRSESEGAFRSAEIIHVNVENMSALVDGLAAFSHRETNRVPTDINELLRRTMDFVRPQNRFDNIHFKFTPDPILPLVNVDPAQLQQVFINLLANAADALAEVDRPVKKIFVETAYDPNAQRIAISFADNGPGIPEANLERIFEPHFTTKVTGHGFGLSTVFRIAANHHGRIHAANVPGGGARFLLDLPNA